MLSPAEMDEVAEGIVDLYEQMGDSVINDIARRINKMNFATPSAIWQMQRLTESGKVYDEILERVAKLTGKSESLLKETFDIAGVKAMAFDDAIYRAAGRKPLPLNLSPVMQQFLVAGLNKTKDKVQNMVLTTALAGQESFIKATDLAYLQISTGVMDYNSAIRQAVKSTAADGLRVIRYTGSKDQIDVAVRRAVLTGIGQTTGQMQWERANEMGQDLVEVTAHAGARNTGPGFANHEGWQGKVFSRSGSSKKYAPFIESTGYGTGPGLLGWNCRHHYFPFFEEISEEAISKSGLRELNAKTVSYNGEKLPMYDATQKQRYFERGVRYWKRQADALHAIGQPNGFEVAKVRSFQAKLRDFTAQTGLQRQPEREGRRLARGTGRPLPPPKPVSVLPPPPPPPPIPPPPSLPIRPLGQTWDDFEKERLELIDFYVKKAKASRGKGLSQAEEEMLEALWMGSGRENRVILVRNALGEVKGVLGYSNDQWDIIIGHFGFLDPAIGKEGMRLVAEQAIAEGKTLGAIFFKSEAKELFESLGIKIAKGDIFSLDTAKLRMFYIDNWGLEALEKFDEAHDLHFVPAPKQIRTGQDGLQISKTDEVLGAQGAFETERVHIEGNGDGVLKTDTSNRPWGGYKVIRGFAHREVTASKIDDVLQLNVVPKTTEFTEVGSDVYKSLQRFVENADMGEDILNIRQLAKDLDDPDDPGKILLLDLITGNPDRHGGNWMTNGKKVFAIDNGLGLITTETAQGTFEYSQFSFQQVFRGQYPLSPKYKDILEDALLSGKLAKALDTARSGGLHDSTLIEAALKRASEVLDNWDKFFKVP
jgi:hypothetical protein